MLFSKTHLKAGDLAPDFTLSDQAGRPVKLSDLRGRRVVLYFYPKASTPGCTTEACGLRDQAPRLPEDVTVLGVSKDSVAAQRKFSDRHKLLFALLADEKGEVIRLYGVDLVFGIAKRRTFLVGSDSRIAKVFESVDPRTHAGEVAAALRDVT